MLTSLAMGLRSFAFFRFLLGAGESANWPAATKAVSEWFPKHERGWAVALFDSGSSIGGAVASVLVLWLYFHFGWRAAFVVPGVLGLLWLSAWRLIYHPLESHPRVRQAEREMILRDRQEAERQEGGERMTFCDPQRTVPEAARLLRPGGLFAFSTFAYAAFSTMALVLPSDLYRSESVATVSGMSGTGAGIGTIISTYLIGYISDRYAFGPILIAASLVPLVGMVLVLLLVRNRPASGPRFVRQI